MPNAADAQQVLTPLTRLFLTQAFYEFVAARYLSENERNSWEQVFTDDGLTPDVIQQFMSAIEHKSGKTIRALMQEIQTMVQNDTTDVLVNTISESIPKHPIDHTI